MTQEEKAKAYDEAIRVGRDILKSTTCEVALALKQVIPALDKTESEDERIRKRILQLVSGDIGHDDLTDYENRQMRAWLEKQKEEISAKPEALKKAYKKGREDALKEQKSAEWSAHDEIMLSNLIDDENSPLDSETLSWLKSLRGRSEKPNSHWKPSEEQMIEFAIIIAPYEREKEGKAIYSLYDDLKKLGNDILVG